MSSSATPLTYDRLSEDQISESLASAPGWQVDGSTLCRAYTFGSYAEGLVFAVAVGRLADALNHHPDLLIGYKSVRVSVSTHDAGGLTAYDFELARRIASLG